MARKNFKVFNVPSIITHFWSAWEHDKVVMIYKLRQR